MSRREESVLLSPDILCVEEIVQLNNEDRPPSFVSLGTADGRETSSVSLLRPTVSAKKKRTNFLVTQCHQSQCYQTLGCVFAIAASSIGIAALIFALISYRASSSDSSTTLTPSTSYTTTTSTTSTSTSTTSITTTSTSSISTTSTTTTTTSTSTTSSTTICSTTQMTTRSTVTPLPPDCSSATSISDGTRRASNIGGSSTCDRTTILSPQWIRFTGGSGASLANCPVATNRCGTGATGWYTGVYPAIAGETTEGVVCYNWANNLCAWQNQINITNCNGFYIYYLSPPPTCNARYCTI